MKMDIKVKNEFGSTLSLYYKADSRKKETKGFDTIKLMPGVNKIEVSDAEFKQVKPKLEFYQKANKISYSVIEDAEVVGDKAPAEALTAENYMDSKDKEALKVFGATVGLEVNKQKSLDKIKAAIAEAIEAKAE
jgi:hypothetical protein